VAWPPSVPDEQQVVIKGAWVQEGPPSQTITAAFMLIENHGPDEIALLSASTDAARVVELHKMELEDGMMRMHRVDSIKIPAGGSVELKPGGYHLMVIGLKKDLKEGDEVSFTLQFSGEIRKTLKVPVKRRDSMTEGDKTDR
jgi:copper(I)-binding protein